jgi:ATP-binding cassette subfamily F protein uup
MNGGNFLILDEPTNDLDLATLRVLEEALAAFDGCVIAVSHDRYFLNRVCNGIMAFEGDGKVHFSEGDYDYYLEKRDVRETEAAVQIVASKKQKERVKIQTTKLTWKEAKELETIEAEIVSTEAEVERIEAIFSSPDFYQKRGEETAGLTEALAAARASVDRLYARWNELEEVRSGYRSS